MAWLRWGGGKVSVPVDHGETLPTAEILDGEKIHAFHGESRRKAVPGIVEPEIFDPGVSDGRGKGSLRPIGGHGGPRYWETPSLTHPATSVPKESVNER